MAREPIAIHICWVSALPLSLECCVKNVRRTHHHLQELRQTVWRFASRKAIQKIGCLGRRLFREKAVEGISSPEQLTDYLRVTNPGIWVMLVAIILLLGGLLAWSAMGTIGATEDAKAIVKPSLVHRK